MSENIKKPWGYFEVLDTQDGYLTKKLYIKPESKLSLQSHKFRSEHWIVVRGSATVTIDENKYILNLNESIYIPIGSKHRLENNSENELIIIEVQIGDKLDEDDIIRYDDIYGREVSE